MLQMDKQKKDEHSRSVVEVEPISKESSARFSSPRGDITWNKENMVPGEDTEWLSRNGTHMRRNNSSCHLKGNLT